MSVPFHPTPHKLECDLIMKGGVTSGLVYPAAIAEIAGTYRLRSIGGTSAGAIAAAGAAAMEFGRQSQLNPAAPDMLVALTAEMGRTTFLGSTFLQALFAPDAQTLPLFPFKMRLPGVPAWSTRLPVYGEMLAVLIGGPLLAGGAIGWALAAGWPGFTPPAATLSGVLTFLILFALLLPSVINIIIQRAAARFVDNGQGLVTGMTPSHDECDRKPIPGITPWLHQKLQELAGLAVDDASQVLTFGHLWRGHRHGMQPPIPIKSDDTREIDLVLVATDLNRLQSVNFPFLPERSRLFIDQRKWQRLFPAPVMDAIRNTSIGPAGKRLVSDEEFKKMLRYDREEIALAASASGDKALHANMMLLPNAADIPVIAAVRASLAFPGLFTPLPLLLLHWVHVAGKRVPRLSPVMLADGGITSNFPIHLFDAPIPSRPTFAINLLYPDDTINADPFIGGPRETNDSSDMETMSGGGGASSTPTQDIFMPRSNSGRVLLYKAPPAGTPIAQVSGLIARVVEAARTWGDISLFSQPGVRDRIVHVRLTDTEGGFNLGMSQATIAAISAKGRFAGEVLASRFNPEKPIDPLHPGQPVVLNWHNHRFVRLRAFLAAQELIGIRATAGWAKACDQGIRQSVPGLDTILNTAGTAAWTHGFSIGYTYNLTADRREHMRSITGLLAQLVPAPGGSGSNSAAEGAPQPRSRLVMRPAGTDPAATRT
jgi:predicted acylesterase/phospholipase RssA